MTRPLALIALCFFGLITCVLLTARLTPGGLELALTLVKDDCRVMALPMQPNERFTIRYFHSVENAPIWETHSMDAKGRIFIEEEKYEKFGAGMGKMPGVGRMITRGIYEVITDMHMPVGNFILRVGSPGVDHTLIWRDRQINLSQMLAHRAVMFSGRPVSMLGQWQLSLSAWMDAR